MNAQLHQYKNSSDVKEKGGGGGIGGLIFACVVAIVYITDMSHMHS